MNEAFIIWWELIPIPLTINSLQVIVNVQPDDAGDYSVVAKNPLGEAVSTGSLSVIRPRVVEGGEEEGRGAMPFPPGFIRQLKNKHVFVKMPAIFDCLVVGYPPPDVDW